MKTQMMRDIEYWMRLSTMDEIKASMSVKYLDEARQHLTNEEKLQGAKLWLEK